MIASSNIACETERPEIKGGTMNPMITPGMTAEASLYRSNLAYSTRTTCGPAYWRNAVMVAADSCQCTSPSCTWSCPPPTTDPCAHCGPQTCNPKVPGCCATILCRCVCEGGIPIHVRPSPQAPCGFVCT